MISINIKEHHNGKPSIYIKYQNINYFNQNSEKFHILKNFVIRNVCHSITL